MRTSLVLSLILAGLAPGCLKPPAATTATAGATGSTSTDDSSSSTSTTAPTTTSTETTTASGSTTGVGPEPLCDEGELYICRLDDSGECGDGSLCTPNDYACTPGGCSFGCKESCGLGWQCVLALGVDMLVCAPNYDDMCSLFQPDGCPEGTKCMPWANDGGSSWNAHKCAPLDPDPVGPGEVCTTESGGSGLDNCDVGSMCWDVDPETKEGQCIAFCMGTNVVDAYCDPGYRCIITAEASLVLCLPDCDPIAQDCPGDDPCIPSGDHFICVLDASGEAGFYADPCEYPNACNPGLYCMPPEYVEDCDGAGCCTPFCELSEPLMCPGATQECIPWFDEGEAPPGSEDVGICGVPQ